MTVDWFPLWLSLRVASLATVLSLGIGLWLGWLLSGWEFRGKSVLEALVDLPLVLPPTVLGYYLLVLLGQGSPAGRLYESIMGGPLLFTWKAAVLASLIYTTPLMVRSVRAALEGLGPAYARSAAALGATDWRTFWSVKIPLAHGPILAAIALAFARSMADFGITIMIAGNLPGRTQTLSVGVYDAVARGDGATARALVLAVSGLALVLLYAASWLKSRKAA